MAEQQTIVIDNFTGSLTRTINGLMNSGMAKFATSWGYNPFKKPGNLTWNLIPLDITSSINGMVVAAVPRFEGEQFIYAVTDTGHFVKIRAINSAITDLHTFSTGSPTFNYGASMLIFANKVWVSSDKGLSYINFDGTGETQVGTWDSSHFIQDTYHPLSPFQGKLFIGNTTDGTTTNIGYADTTLLIQNYNVLTPAIPQGQYIRDMDIASDFSYLIMSVSSIPQEILNSPGFDIQNSATTDSFVYRWNGTDQAITSGISIPGFGITALNNFGQSEYAFMYDALGLALYDGGKKILTLPNNKSPLPNASSASGNMVVWCAPEVDVQIPDSPPTPGLQAAVSSMYYFGKLDEDSPAGLWRMLRTVTQLTNGSVTEVPFMDFVNNQFISVKSDGTLLPILTQQFFSRYDFVFGGTTQKQLFAFYNVYSQDIVEFNGICAGVYETQTQLFSKKIGTSNVRVYCEPTQDGNSFKFDLIGMDGLPISGGTFTYAYTAGTDITLLQGSLTRINFNTDIAPTFALGIRITNLGINTVRNMVINKVEIDYGPEGR